jgi:uncharacterized protein YqhQ
MEFDDIINRNNRRSNNYNTHGEYRNSSYSSYSNRRYDHNYKMRYFLENIRNNRKLKLLLITAAIVILAIIIALLLILLPLIIKLFNYINQNGIQDVIDYLTAFLDKIWRGSAT